MATINKQRYWPQGVDGGAIKSHLINMDIGTTDLLLGSYIGHKFNVIYMKESKWVYKYMASFGSVN